MGEMVPLFESDAAACQKQSLTAAADGWVRWAACRAQKRDAQSSWGDEISNLKNSLQVV